MQATRADHYASEEEFELAVDVDAPAVVQRRRDAERTRELIRESVAKLGASFDAVNRKSRQQGEVVGTVATNQLEIAPITLR